MELKQNLSSQLSALRKARQESLETVSEVTGISKSTLQDIEKGKGSTKLDTVDVLAKGLGVHPLLLLSAQDQRAAYELAQYFLGMLRSLNDFPEPQRQLLTKDLETFFNHLFMTTEGGGQP